MHFLLFDFPLKQQNRRSSFRRYSLETIFSHCNLINPAPLKGSPKNVGSRCRNVFQIRPVVKTKSRKPLCCVRRPRLTVSAWTAHCRSAGNRACELRLTMHTCGRIAFDHTFVWSNVILSEFYAFLSDTYTRGTTIALFRDPH